MATAVVTIIYLLLLLVVRALISSRGKHLCGQDMYKLLRCKGWTEISLFVEDVPQERLGKSDKIIGFLAWILAQGGLVMSIPGFFSLMLVAELVGRIFEAINFRRLVVTDVIQGERPRQCD